ncbi:MAG TPA: ATP-binding protein [Candidatus Scybalomonas excrementigallinarum]|nr:ATP-binding protein [Candidatus Scybalomonas excrementigallinarum]
MFHKLEEHLKEVSEQYKEYENLYASWCLNKKACIETLQTVVFNYPHYSVHDARHSETVLASIELLLGEDRIQLLSPTDTWLLLHAVYAHDLGMFLSAATIEKVWSTKEFQEYIKNLCHSQDTNLSEAAQYICNFSEKTKENVIWPLSIRKYVMQIIEDYFRRYHASISKEYITRNVIKTKAVDWIQFDQNGLIPKRLVALLGEISELHMKSFDDVLQLEHITNGYNADYAHSRFIAELLRLGDLLDADNGRFNDSFEAVGGELPELSKAHKEKHNATEHLLITPEKIEYVGNCSTREAYRSARGFVDWLEEEIKNCILHWTEIVPSGFPGQAPRLGKVKLLYNGRPDVEGLNNLKFKMSQEKAFQVVEGSNIYENPLVFIREIIQNAQDATKIQLWRDLKAGQYDFWMEGKKIDKSLQPFDIKKDIYDNYKIEVRVNQCEDGYVLLEVEDRGTGIDVDGFKRMCNVGASYSGNNKSKKEIEEMPLWLRPTGGFGIGLQSIFLVADEFEIITRAEGERSLKGIVQSWRKGGFLQVEYEDKEEMKRGTIVKVKFKLENYTLSWSGDTVQYLLNEYDFFSYKDYRAIIRVIEEIKSNFIKGFFPVKVSSMEFYKGFIEELIIDGLEIIGGNCKEFGDDNPCKYDLDEYGKMIIWDTKKYVKIEITLNDLGTKVGNTEIFFKGVKLKNDIGIITDGLDIRVDIYGMDTKESISLDRKKLKNNAKNDVIKLVDNSINFYAKKLIEMIGKGAERIGGNNIYTVYYLLESRLEGSGLIKNINQFIEKSTERFSVLEYENNEYCEKGKRLIELVDEKEKYVVLNFNERERILEDNDTLRERCNRASWQEKLLIVDKEFIKSVSNKRVSNFKINKENGVLCYKVENDSEYDTVIVEKETKEMLILGLCESQRNENGMRAMIPAMKEYEVLATDGIISRWVIGTMIELEQKIPYIISPISKNDEQERQKYQKEQFIEYIASKPEFDNIVEYVKEHTIFAEIPPKEEEIIEKYKELIGEYYDLKQEEANKNQTEY